MKLLMWEVERQLFAAYNRAGALHCAQQFFREHAGEPWCPRHRLTVADVVPWMRRELLRFAPRGFFLGGREIAAEIGVWGVAPPTESESLKSALKFPLKPPRAIDAGQNQII